MWMGDRGGGRGYFSLLTILGIPSLIDQCIHIYLFTHIHTHTGVRGWKRRRKGKR